MRRCKKGEARYRVENLLCNCMLGTYSWGLYKAEMGATILAMALCSVHKAKANTDITYQASATFTLNGRDGYNKPGYNPAHIWEDSFILTAGLTKWWRQWQSVPFIEMDDYGSTTQRLLNTLRRKNIICSFSAPSPCPAERTSYIRSCKEEVRNILFVSFVQLYVLCYHLKRFISTVGALVVVTV